MALCINTFSELALRSQSVFDDSFLLVYDPKIPFFFLPRRVFIIRGRVVTMTGQGLGGFIRCTLGLIREGLLGYIWGLSGGFLFGFHYGFHACSLGTHLRF